MTRPEKRKSVRTLLRAVRAHGHVGASPGPTTGRAQMTNAKPGPLQDPHPTPAKTGLGDHSRAHSTPHRIAKPSNGKGQRRAEPGPN